MRRFATAGLILGLALSGWSGLGAQVWVEFQPNGGPYTTSDVTVDVDFCSETAPLTSERFIILNNVDVTHIYFSQVGSVGGCNGWSERWRGTIPLELGTNELFAYAYSFDDQWGSNSTTFVYSLPVATVTVTNTGSSTLGVGQTSTFVARAFAADGTEMFGHTFYWSGTRMHATSQSNPQATSVTAVADVAGAGSMTAMTSNVSGSANVTVVNPTYGVSVSSNRASTITLSPGATSTGTTTYTVTNTSTYTSTASNFTMTATPSPSVIGTCNVSPSNAMIAPNNGSVQVTVSCPIGPTFGSSSPTVTFRAATSSPSSFEQSHVTTYNVSANYVFAVSMPNGNPVTQGQATTSGEAFFRIHNNSTNTSPSTNVVLDISCTGAVYNCSGPPSVSVSEGSTADVRVTWSVKLVGQNGSVRVGTRLGSTNYGFNNLQVNTTPRHAVAVTASNLALLQGATSGSITYTVTNVSSNTSTEGAQRQFNIGRSCGTPLLVNCTGVTSVWLADQASTTVTTGFNVTATGNSAAATLTASSSSPTFSQSASPIVSIPPLYRVRVTTMSLRNLAELTRNSTASFTIANESRNTTASSYNFLLTASCGVMASGCTIPNLTTIPVPQGTTGTYDVPFDVSITGTTGWVKLKASHSNFPADSATQNLTITPHYVAQVMTANPVTLNEQTTSGSTTFTVRNTSENAGPLVFTLATSCTPPLTSCSSPSPSSVTLNHNETSPTITVPYAVTQTGSVGSLTLTASAASGALVTSGPNSITVKPWYAIAVLPAATSASVAAGASGTLALRIRNDSWNAAQNVTAILTATGCGNATISCALPTVRIGIAQGATSGAVNMTYHGLAPGAESLDFGATVTSPVTPVAVTTAAVTVNVTASGPLITIARGLNAGTAIDRSSCLAIAAGQRAAYECGDLRVVHQLPATATMAKTRAPALIYNSRHAIGNALIQANVRYNSTAVPSAIRASVTINGTTIDTSFAWTPSCLNQSCRIVVPTGSLPTGIYPFTIRTTALSGATVLATSAIVTDTVIVVNRSASPFGRGWWLEGLERLEVVNGVPRLWIGGDGSARLFASTSNASIFVAPAFDRPDTLLKINDTTWRRMLGDSVYVEFDGQGRHRATRNDLGWRTRFTYSTVSGTPLDSIVLPVPSATSPARAYVFTFTPTASGPALDIVKAPALGTASAPIQRLLVVHRSGNVQIDGFTDPDGRRTSFGYDNGRMSTRTNQLLDVTIFRYDAGGAMREAERDMSRTGGPNILTKFRAAETRALPGQAMRQLADVYTHLDGPRDIADTTVFFLNRWGSPDTIVSAAHEVSRVRRTNAAFPSLATVSISPSGMETQAHFNGRALVDSIVEVNPLGDDRNAVRRFTWHSKWNRVTASTTPTGEVTTTSYHSSFPVILWTQPGSDATRRTSIGYNAFWQVATIQPPGNTTSQQERLDYDAVYGNLMRATTPIGFITRSYKDDIGRDTLVASPTDSALSRTDANVLANGMLTVTRYDIMGRVDTVKTIGRQTQYAPVETLFVHNTYDVAGQLTRVARWSSPDSNEIGAIGSEWEYDAAGRAWIARAADGKPDTTFFDPAGNVDSVRTRRGHLIWMENDVVGRLRKRHVPLVQYAPRTVGIASLKAQLTGDSIYPQYSNNASTGGYDIADDVATFTYDAVGRMIAAVNADARVYRGYLPNGLVAAETLFIRNVLDNTFAARPYAMGYSYDLSRRRTELRHPAALAAGSQVTRHTYDIRGDLDTIIDPLGNRYRYSYRTDGLVHQLSLPATLRYDYAYDIDDNMKTLATWLDNNAIRVVNMRYDGRGRLWNSNNAFGSQDQLTVRYSGLGAVVSSQSSATGVNGFNATGTFTSTETYSLDALGNMRSKTLSTTTQFEHGSNSSVSPRANGYEAGTGRLVISANSTEGDTTEYDAAGNVTMTWQSLLTASATLNDRASYYDAENRLRAADYRAWSHMEELISPYKTVFEEFRYDALGRRVLMWTRRYCEDYDQGSPQGAARNDECNIDLLRRTVWDGDRELYEIQRPGDTLYSALMENDTQATGLSPMSSGVDPKAFFGVIGYVNGLNVDQPLGIIRAVYQERGGSVFPAFTIVPLWNQKGQADRGYVIGAPTCGSGSQSGCVIIDWPIAWSVYGAGDRIPLYFHGSLTEDKLDKSGTMYRRNRQYDATTGRFTQEDPIGLAGGMNLYGFAAGDPINFGDPFGLCPDPNKPWCTSPGYHILRFFGVSDATADKIGSIFYAGAMGAGGPGTGMGVRGAAGLAAAGSQVGIGTKVYRVYGGKSQQMGASWTTVNPSTTADFAAQAGLPAENAMTNVVEGVIADTRGITVTTATPGARGPGGIIEVKIPNAAKQVKVTAVKPYEPPQ